MMNTANFMRVLSMALLLSVLQFHSAAFAQSLTVPAQFVYWTTYGPPGGPGSRYYYFATGDEACQFACQQGDSRCRDSGSSQTFTGTGACGAVIGGISGGLGAAGTGGNIWVGMFLGAAGGFAVGFSGQWVTALGGQVWMRAGAGAVGNTLGQMQRLDDPCFRINYGSIVGSAMGGAFAGLIAPAAHGVRFGEGLAGFAQSSISGIPGAAVGTTFSIVGTGLGGPRVGPRN